MSAADLVISRARRASRRAIPRPRASSSTGCSLSSRSSTRAARRHGDDVAEAARRGHRRQHVLRCPHHLTFEPWVKAWGEALRRRLDTAPGSRATSGTRSRWSCRRCSSRRLLGALNGYVLTKWRFPGHKLVFGMMLFACFIPFQSVLIPMAVILGKLGEIGQIADQDLTGVSFGFGNPTVNLVLVHVVYGLGFTTLFFRNYYEAFPTELVKAAMIDGAGFFQIFRRILLPNSAPIFIVTVIYQFTNIWNDFLFGSTFAAGDQSPMTVALNNLVNTSTGVDRIQRQHGGGDHRRRSHAARLHCRRPLLRARSDGRRGEGLNRWPFSKSARLRKRFGAARNSQGHRPDARQGRLSRAGRSVRLRQVDAAQHDRRPRIDQLRRNPHRRPRDQRPAPVQARHRDGVPVLRALSRTCRWRENMAFGMEMRGVPKAERDKAVAAVAKTLQIEQLLEPPPEPALRRPAPARRHGPRAGASAARLPVRRAAVEPRRQAARRHARRDQAASSGDRRRRSSMSPTTRSRR